MSHANNIALNGATLISEDAVQTYSGSLTLTGTNSFQVVSATKNAIWSGAVSGPGIFNKSGAGTLILSGANASFTSASSVAGPLTLNYVTNDNRKISSGVLTLSGGSIELVGGTFADSVASTTLTASTANTITRSSGTATLNLGAITIGAASSLNFVQSGIARTTNANNANGILGVWATIGGTQPAMNDGTGLIVAATTTDLTRLSSGSKVIANGVNNNVLFIEGTGTAGNFTLGSAVTTINTLTQSAVGGVTAATVDMALQTLALNSVSVGTGAGALTIGTALNNGTLRAAGTAIEFRDLAAAGITVNSIIADGTGATTLTKTDPGTLTFAGTNSYTGGTVVNAGTLTASLGTTAGVRFPFGSGAITANSGTTLRFFAGSTTNAMSHGNTINLNGATLTSEEAVQTFSGNIVLSGANTVNVTTTTKDAIFSGVVSGAGSLTKASAGLLTLANANTYSGGTTISGGTLRTTNTAALGAAAQPVTLSGGTLQLATDAALSSKNLTVSASSTITLDRLTGGGGISTSFGALTFGNNLTLTVNNGANVTNGISTLNFTGFPALGAASTTTTFALGANVEVNLSGNLTGTQAFASVAKTGAGTLILSGNNNFWDPTAGLVTISGGTLDLRSQNAMGDGLIGGNRIDLSMAAATTLRLGTDTSLGNNANVTLTGSGATIISDRASAGAGILNQFNILNIGAFTLNVTGGNNVTSGTTQVNFNSATLTGNAVLNVVNPTAGSTNMLVSGIMSGAFSLTKTGSGTLTLQGANSYSTTTAISGGTLNLSGANGAITSSTGITLSTGGILTLANTGAANNGNRIANTLAMNGGTLNFTNTQGAFSYAEATGALSVGGGTNTITTGQAATGQTSLLTFASLARTAGTLNFTGTGLGTTVDPKNEIRFTTNPTLTAGIIGTWATVNGTDFATTTGANNSVVAYSAYTDVARLGVSASTIANGATTNVRIVEGTGSAFNILLGAPLTTINTLNQSTSGGTSAAIIDPDLTNTTLAVNSILVSSGAGGLTIGTAAADGNLRAVTTALQVIENSTGGSTINSTITDGSAASSFTKSGSGLLTLTGTNSYTGVTTIEGGILAVSVMAAGGSNSGIGAAPVAAANLVLNNGTLRYTGSTVSSNRGFTIAAGTTGTVDVSDSAATLTLSGGIAATTGSLVKSGAGSMLLSATNSFTGNVTILGGIARIGNQDAFGVRTTAVTKVTVGSGASVDFNGQIDATYGYTIAGTGVGSSGALVNNGAAIGTGSSQASNITLAGDASIGGTGNWALLAAGYGPTNLNLAGFTLTKSGTNTVTLANTTITAGNIVVAGGTLATFTPASTGASTALTLNNTTGVSLSLGANLTVGSLAGGGASGGNVVLGGNTLTVGALNTITTYAGVISGTGSVTKNGTGTLALTGINTHTGATLVNDGVLNLNIGGGPGAIRSSLSIASGATVNLNIAEALGSAQGTRVGAITITGGTLHVANTGNNSVTSQSITFTGGSLTGVASSKMDLRNNGVGNTNLISNAATTTATISVPTIGMPGNDTTITTASGTTSSGVDMLISSAIVNNAGTGGAGGGTSSIIKAGAGVLRLSGVNTYTGATTVSAGVLSIGAGGTTSVSSTITVSTGATLRLDRTDAWGNHQTLTSSPIVVNAGGTVASNGFFNTLVNPTLNGGTVTLNGGASATYPAFAFKGTLTVGGSVASNINVGTGINNLINIGPSGTAGTLVVNVADATLSAASDLNINAVLQDNKDNVSVPIPSALSKTGAGTMTLTGANTYSGGTVLNQGTLTVGTGGTLGATSGALAVNNNNTGAATAVVLNLATAVNTTTGSLSGTIAAATPASPANTATINVATGRTLTVNQTAAGTYAGAIAGLGGLTLGASSTNTLTLTGVNTYTDATTISSGQLTIDDGSIATSSGILNNAALEYKLNVNARTYANAISGSGTLSKTGTNTLTLTGANTYTGATTVSAGTLALVGGSQASPVTVSSGASLSFTLGSPTTSTSSFNVTAGTIKITGPATLPSYTLISSSTGITGTPTLHTPIPGYLLKKVGNTLVLENPYEVWAAATGATGGKTGDPDNDGLENLLEYAFGTNPTVNFTGSLSYSPSVVPGQPVLQEDGGVWYAVFGRRTDYVAAGLTYSVQFSSALSTWEPTGVAPTTLATDGTIDVVRVPFLNFVDLLGPNGPQKPTFFRVQVSQ